MPSIPQLEESCFGCCSLRTGSQIIGWLSFLKSALLFLLLSLGLIGLLAVTGKQLNPDDPESAEMIRSILLIILGVLDLFIFAYLIVNVMNLMGIYQEKPHLMRPWLIFVALGIVLGIISFFVLLVNGNPNSDVKINPASVGFGCAIDIYFFLIVNSYYKAMQSGRVGMNV